MPMAEDIESTQDIDVYASRTDWTPQFVKFTVDKGIATIALNRPPANVLSIEAMEDLNRALEQLEYRREVKLVVVRGEGKYFSAGLELNDHLGDRGYVMLEACRRIFDNLAKTDKPSLAVVAGPALGAGSLLAGACDITLAARAPSSATRRSRAACSTRRRRCCCRGWSAASARSRCCSAARASRPPRRRRSG
jgi:1,4-dihydroxy-2-naphthoyl-CoA synthase